MTAGPAYFWTIPVILFGQILVALVFAEAVSQYPIAGGVYQWARHLVGPRWGFLTAFMYLLALLATNAGLAYGGAPYLAALFGYEATPITNAIGAAAFILLAAITNFAGTKSLAKGVEAGVWAGILGSPSRASISCCLAGCSPLASCLITLAQALATMSGRCSLRVSSESGLFLASSRAGTLEKKSRKRATRFLAR